MGQIIENTGRLPEADDYPLFYEHPFIKSISEIPRWTISTEDKMPIDINSFLFAHKYRLNNDPYKDSLSLTELVKFVPQARNHAFYMDALQDSFILVDVEPKCPDEIKERFLAMDWIYGEVSLSGHGYHLVFRIPESFDTFDYAKNRTVMKDPERGYFEVMLNHWVTFTRSMIKRKGDPAETFDDFYKEYAVGFNHPKEQAIDIQTDRSQIEDYDLLVERLEESLDENPWDKDPEDFLNDDGRCDHSRYEFNVLRFYGARLANVLHEHKLVTGDIHKYAPDELALMVYDVAAKRLEHRPKHDQTRDDMPFLLYQTTAALAGHELDMDNERPDMPEEWLAALNWLDKSFEGWPAKKGLKDYKSAYKYHFGLAGLIDTKLHNIYDRILHVPFPTDEELVWFIYDGLVRHVPEKGCERTGFSRKKPYLYHVAVKFVQFKQFLREEKAKERREKRERTHSK